MIDIDQTKYNIGAFKLAALRCAKKRDAARKPHTRARWQKKAEEAEHLVRFNQERLAEHAATLGRVPNPGEVPTLDFLGIGFTGGVESALAEFGRLYPDLPISIDARRLRMEWALKEANMGELISFNAEHDGVFTITHGWAFRVIAASFLSYMDEIKASNYVTQEIRVTPKLESGIEHISITIRRLGNKPYGQFTCQVCEKEWKGEEIIVLGLPTGDVWTCGDPCCKGEVVRVDK